MQHPNDAWIDELLAPCTATTTDHHGVEHRCVYEPGHTEPMHLALHRVGGVVLRIEWSGAGLAERERPDRPQD